LGVRCRYDGKSKPDKKIKDLLERYELIPVCPEIMGGLSTPRNPAEISNGKVISDKGEDVTKEYIKGARETLKIARIYGCRYAILKENSPSCGTGKIYDGTFTKKLTYGYGIAADLLKKNGIKVIGETELEILENLEA
jgi:uncharacterized protein YbbK (DUF523 family)